MADRSTQASPDTDEPLVVFALEREAAPFRRLRLPVRVVVSGVGREAARQATADALRLMAHPPRLVIAAGFGGALRPGLRVGDVIVSPHEGQVYTADRVVGDPAAKRRLHAETSADVVDMESAGVFAAAGEQSVPAVAVRAVSDTVDTALSPQLAGLLDGGHVSVRQAAVAVVRHPRLLGEFRRLARDTRVAAGALAVRLAELCVTTSTSGRTGPTSA